MKFSQVYSIVAITLSPLVSAHGFVSTSTIGGAIYLGYDPNTDPYYSPPKQKIFRKIPGNGPVTDVSLIDVQCNGYTDGGTPGSAPAPISASVAAGSKISLTWTQWPDSHKGPLITYMAKCPGSCTTYSPGSSAVWFKVAQAGKDASGVWATTPYEAASPPPYTFTVPAALAPGNYIVRHEIIALHAAYSYPGAQIYPSCIQVTVTGSGTKTPTSLVAFPGAYNANTPGIVYNMYTNTSAYPIPGPTVWSG